MNSQGIKRKFVFILGPTPQTAFNVTLALIIMVRMKMNKKKNSHFHDPAIKWPKACNVTLFRHH
jgi:hypothetical protein